jgi:hypothetical protein
MDRTMPDLDAPEPPLRSAERAICALPERISFSSRASFALNSSYAHFDRHRRPARDGQISTSCWAVEPDRDDADAMVLMSGIAARTDVGDNLDIAVRRRDDTPRCSAAYPTMPRRDGPKIALLAEVHRDLLQLAVFYDRMPASGSDSVSCAMRAKG